MEKIKEFLNEKIQDAKNNEEGWKKSKFPSEKFAQLTADKWSAKRRAFVEVLLYVEKLERDQND